MQDVLTFLTGVWNKLAEIHVFIQQKYLSNIV